MKDYFNIYTWIARTLVVLGLCALAYSLVIDFALLKGCYDDVGDISGTYHIDWRGLYENQIGIIFLSIIIFGIFAIASFVMGAIKILQQNSEWRPLLFYSILMIVIILLLYGVGILNSCIGGGLLNPFGYR